MTVRTAIHRSVPASALPDFTPVPRKIQRHDGWTPERQRAFIEALADTGCVAIACRMVNMSQPSYYQLRRQPGAESFRAAADAAQTLGLQPVKDEAFHRAMVGEMIPVFVAGKLMGFRRKKNDRLLMFILRHYGQDAQGRKTTINYFSTRATAGAAQLPSPQWGEGDSRSERGEGESGALAAAEASTTTVKTVISGPGDSPTQLAADDNAANILNAFEGVDLDSEAQDQIYRALTACAERRRALEGDPENDPERFFIGEAETTGYLGELESGVEGDWVEYRPEGEHLWENLGEGGQAVEIDRVLAEMAERREQEKLLPAPEPDGKPPSASPSVRPEALPSEGSPELVERVEGPVEGPMSPRREHKPRKRPPEQGRRAYKKRTPKPSFTPLVSSEGEGAYEARKAEAVAAVEAERRAGAADEAERRKGGAEG